MVYVLKELMGQEVVELWHKDTDLQGADFIVLPGGFSYGDYLRSGAIAKFSPIMESVIAHANTGGYVMGICNGFQILTESGLLEGALLHNDTQKFICKNVFLKPVSKSAAPSQDLNTNQAYQIPIAHGEGRFYADDATIASLQANDQILFTYCAADGSQEASSNPNGSLLHIAGITNRNKNVFGMMPHPDRAFETELGSADGALVFQSLLEAA
jgi:phosphoribosylformylglycinamidine synthase